jgi:hypothetical protein
MKEWIVRKDCIMWIWFKKFKCGGTSLPREKGSKKRPSDDDGAYPTTSTTIRTPIRAKNRSNMVFLRKSISGFQKNKFGLERDSNRGPWFYPLKTGKNKQNFIRGRFLRDCRKLNNSTGIFSFGHHILQTFTHPITISSPR